MQKTECFKSVAPHSVEDDVGRNQDLPYAYAKMWMILFGIRVFSGGSQCLVNLVQVSSGGIGILAGQVMDNQTANIA